MKLVIYTQIRENYGAHDWDGEGECPQYWKNKGGEVYVVENLTPAQVRKINESGIPTLSNLLSSQSEMFQESVVDVSILGDNEKVCDEWETPFTLSYENQRWVGRRTVPNGEFGYMNRKIASKSEEYDLLPDGDRTNYKVVYTMVNGDVVPSQEVDAYLSKAA